MYSPLCDDFVPQLQGLVGPDCLVYPFENITSFHRVMQDLITSSSPCYPAAYQQQEQTGQAPMQGEV